MLISHYFEFAEQVTGGIRAAVSHQRKMLDHCGIEYVTAPRLDVDLLHLNLMGPRSLFYASRARARDVPVVIHTHVTAEDFGNSFRLTNLLSKPLRPYLRLAYSLGDVLVCPSEYNRGVIEAYADVPTEVISNGVDTTKLTGAEALREDALREFDLTPPVVFQVGHVIKRKGLRTFVETARQLPSFDFVWFGPIDRRLKGRSTRRLIDGAPDNCRFPGYVDDIRVAYAAGDIFFFPTHEENEGIALLEAMATGTPPVVRDIETFDWLSHGEDCLKVDGDFAAALSRLEEPSRREELGSSARQRSEQFHLPTVAPAYESLYEGVTA